MKSRLLERNAACTLSRTDIKRLADAWLLDSEFRQVAAQTLYARRVTTEKLLWWMEQRDLRECGSLEIKQFLAYIANGHTDKGGRWGNSQQTRKARPSTIATYFNRLRSFFAFGVAEGMLDANPVEDLKPPIVRGDQITPFTREQVTKVLAAAKESRYAKRDSAIVLFLLDTGLRASELCDLRMHDVDLNGRRCMVLGKGNKHRTVFFSATTGKAIWSYLKGDEREGDAPLFASERGGKRNGDPLTRSGLGQLIEKLGEAAKLEAVRCSPHTFRHTFAIEFLRAGGNVFTLKEMLGHTNLGMTQKYLALALADVANQHRQYSPVEAMRKGGRK
jgi:site-specific recombinase XerD